MAGETQRMQAVKELDAESKQQDEGAAKEQQRDKTTKESSEPFRNTGTEARATSTGASIEKLEKERDCPQQREAVIRPQQAGKIDFRSLQNRSKLATDRTWSTGKGSPQSPNGKSRSKEKGKRSGKTECGNPQQLYRLSITNPRSNPNIGIAYPQQKVPPPKKLETSRGPVSDRYRFHIQSIPERESDLQQEELSYSRCFQEASSNLTSPSYTSQALVTSSGPSSHLHPPLSQQQSASMETSSPQPGGQLILGDFHLVGSNSWQSPGRTFNGANFGVSSQKNITFTEVNKTSAFVPSPFQYGYNFLEESNPDTFSCEPNLQSQDCADSSLGSVHVAHKSLSFATEEGQNIAHSGTQYSKEQQEDRSSYPQPTQFIQAVASSIQCPHSLSEDSVGSDSSSSQQSEQGKSESKDIIGQVDSRDAAITSGNKRNCHSKDPTANQRTLISGGVHYARNISQVTGSQMHFSSKTFSSPVSNIHTGAMSYDKNINNKVLNRLPNTWEGTNKTLSQPDQSTIEYSDMNDKFHFQSQTAIDQRSSSKNSRMPWQQIRPASAMSNQNRLELSRQINSQKMAYTVSSSDWQDDSKSHKHSSLKSPGSFQNGRTSEGFSNQRQEGVKHNGNATLCFKTEMGHVQICESKNKALYFGLNQSLPAASSRSYSYPPLQVAPMGHMMVSPHESPLPSPVHNPSSSCSSLSPASTSPVNISSEDNLMSKSATLHPFYHQNQAKTQLPTEQLSSHLHQFQPDTPQSLPFAPDRAKDDMMSYLQSSTHPKPTVDGNKVYVDSFGLEHNQPPPPYSAHQLLATSLATANLDQLDVLLKCRQCDQNFNNLASFLGHKQFCAQQTSSQNELKDTAKIENSRKFHTDPAKTVSSLSTVPISRCPSDLHLSLLGLNKNGELISDSETKRESKEETIKLNLFSGPGNLPAPLPELEIEDSKLDSLITEALNGLGYQSENAEIDSSFMDVLVDDELTSVKAASTKLGLKAKESSGIESKTKKTEKDDSSFNKEKYFYESDTENSEIDKKNTESKLEKIPLNLDQNESFNINKEASHKSSRFSSREKMREKDRKEKEVRMLSKCEDENVGTPKILLSSKLPQSVKCFQDASSLQGSTRSQASISPPSRTIKESKRKNTGGGTWSKELIHKIVQQKNKLHKLHVKGAKDLQFSLVMERQTPTVQNPAFGEYDYVSDMDDECEPVKIASQGRLNQSNRCKYTYTKECKRRAKNEREQAASKNESKESFEVKKSEEVALSPEKPGSHQKLRRRGSRSSTSSEVSTSVSVSSDAINSPKSIDRNDSDCEKKADVKKKESPSLRTYERLPPQKLGKDPCALTFTKSTRKYGSDKGIVSDSKSTPAKPKDHRSLPDVTDPTSSMQKDTNRYFDKSRGFYTNVRDDVASPSKAAAASESLQSTDILCPRDEPTHCSSPDGKPLQLNSPPSKKEADSTIDRDTKRKTVEEPAAPQLGLSDSCTFEKQSVHMVKESISLASYIDPHKTVSLCSSLMDEVCLSPAASQGQIIPKDALHIMNYGLDQEQSLIKSPLSFDTSSMFEDLTGFESCLYPDMPIQKEGFHPMENIVDKKEVFVSSFSPFLEHRDWNLMVTPVLPDEVSQYKGNPEKSSEKKQDYNHIPLSLPEKIIDYSTNLHSCTSEDELEIKRIVNELENQLQTTKKESPPLIAQDVPKLVKMSKFSPLRLDDVSAIEGSDLDISCPVQTIDVQVASLHSEPFTAPWTSPFQFDIIGGNHNPHTSIHNEEEAHLHNSRKDNNLPNLISLASHQKSEERDAEKDAHVATKEEILDEKQYAANLMKSLEVISDSIFKKVPIISEQEAPSVTSPTSQHQQKECQGKGVAEKENQSKKEAITREENLLSPSNINEQKDNIEFILNESQSSLPGNNDPSVDGNYSISAKPCKPTESNTEARTEATSVEDITLNSNLIDSACCSSVVSNSPHLIETGINHSTAENRNLLFKDSINRQEPLTAGTSQEEGPVKRTPSCSISQPSSPANSSSYIGEKVQTVVTVEFEEQSTNKQSNSADTLSPCAGELREAKKTTEETTEQNHFIRLSPKTCSADQTYSPMSEISGQITDKPCSPILEKSNTEHNNQPLTVTNTQFSEGSSHLLHLPQSSSMTDSESCKEASLTHFEISKAEILNVQDIRDLPVDFMASHQNSPCREMDPSLLLQRTSPNGPFLTSSHQTALQNWDHYQSQSKCDDTRGNQDSIQNIKCPSNKEEDTTFRKTLNSKEHLSTSSVMKYSLISPPPLDLGMIVSKITTCESAVASPPPVTSSAEPQAPGGIEKRNPVYDFKLSPLNYSSVSDEPPQLSQYDYIPISPASKQEETSDTKQSPRDECGPCDLSINPTLIFHNTETATGVTLNSDATAGLNLSSEPLVLPQTLKYLCFSLGLTPEGKPEDPSSQTERTSPDPVILGVDNTHIKTKTSGNPSSPKSLLICENEHTALLPESSVNQPISDQISLQLQKDISPKKAQSNSQQGKVVCEICLMCFRTVPGLKRHKAMKHLVQTDKHVSPRSTMSIHQEAVSVYQALQNADKEHKDDSQTCLGGKINGLPEASGTSIPRAAETEPVLEEKAMETKTMAADEIGSQTPVQPTKSKKNNRARKSKNSDVNMKPDPFSDEILNILKTDILQALNPEFKSCGLNEQHKSPERQVQINDKTVPVTEILPQQTGFHSLAQLPAKEISLLIETVEPNQATNSQEMSVISLTDNANGEIRRETIEEMATCLHQDIMRGSDGSTKPLEKAPEENLVQEILGNAAVEINCKKSSRLEDDCHPLSCLNTSTVSPPGLSPELKALLDDDTTFSQLFPRDEEAKRKKCPRVYSKRNKRQKLSEDLAPDYPLTETFVQKKEQHLKNQAEQKVTIPQTNHCDYETISIDDAMMLNMCHNKTLQADPKTSSEMKEGNQHTVQESIKELDKCLFNPLQCTIDTAVVEQNGSGHISVHSSVTSDPSNYKVEVPSGSCPLTSSTYSVEPCVQSLHTIDIQNINTTFQLPDIQFFDRNRDIVSPPVGSVDMELKEEEKSKTPAEQPVRKRQEGRIKVKDKQYKCKVCFTWFLTLGELNFHKLSHNPSPPPTCYMCVQRKFSSREQLRDHLREKHAKNKTGTWSCGMCLKEISDVWMYNEHLREHATQFARRGQTQGSMLGIPGCFMQETAVKNFITSILQQRPSKTNRESSRLTKEQERVVDYALVGEGRTSEGVEPKGQRAKSSSGTGGKQSTSPPLEVLHKTETHRSVEMHPNCKDPSRDCHHCGKQFPKPFKLQRHLVVHNVEKIFLCHKCPVSYQEAQELKSHLKKAHEEVEELESKHTTLYTCELCADVMHVIKKSFICSTCNYTFSKKEQFDRHMEKHLSGGHKIFKFRGVLRPVKVSASKENECDSPATKKRRILSDSLQENSSDSGIASVSSLHLNQNSDTQYSKASVSTADDSTQTVANKYHSNASNTNVKTEEMTEDYSGLLVELEKCIQMESTATAMKEEIDPVPSPLFDKEGKGMSVSQPCDVKKEDESVFIRAETTPWPVCKDRNCGGEKTVGEKEAGGDAGEKTDPPTSKNAFLISSDNQIHPKTPESTKHELHADVMDPQRDDEQQQHLSKDSNGDSGQLMLSESNELESSHKIKDKVAADKAADNMKNTPAGNMKSTESTPVFHVKSPVNASAAHEDKEPVRPQKKRKDLKSPLQRVSSPATQENFGVDSRAKKKFRPSKCSNPSLQRKSDGSNDYSVLSSVQDDIVSNKIASKCKTSNVGLQSKRSFLDSCTPNKTEIVTSLNGDYKVKKGSLGRALHLPISKVPSVPMNNALNKTRPKMGVRSMESHSYRTAESQNHLLSQLFGQKLTSFKIPLRKDASESIN
ncbi:uncharacterized protein znf469 [Takifugu rubripes]|uniref:uncharacterized protein znf469 n=1 Tax=Takifugu rubripes TaxID=31033 RepID=UPI0011459B43|nr:zinc finger protein 469 [Takifugu rubripes]XP_029697026.1 zinc finger protein 469 [Takifugu rubripes]XP_029697027.1 zinc finger protein 469 [Takifugu rubripes]XP_029697028.1 zinc finger protein 469 [Takifugu rubripes]XP_029697029.1 zinc finger protein 469 [Takifugu rubripes]